MFCARPRFGYFANCGSDPILSDLKLRGNEWKGKAFNVLCTKNSLASG